MTAGTAAGGRRRGECFAGSGEPATCDDALPAQFGKAPAPAFNNFHSGRSLVRVSGFSVCSLPHLGEIFHYKTQQRWIRRTGGLRQFGKIKKGQTLEWKRFLYYPLPTQINFLMLTPSATSPPSEM
jgi:hypothetical protein|uniref:Uncharacterized protein n=1 Tax=Zea mays TaxID=4577 RepID=C0PEG6_MAIZE|nr:unknown [Zea mays]